MLQPRYLTEDEIQAMAQAAFDSYEMTGDPLAAMRAAQEHATDELGVRPTRTAVKLAHKLAMALWDETVIQTRNQIQEV